MRDSVFCNIMIMLLLCFGVNAVAKNILDSQKTAESRAFIESIKLTYNDLNSVDATHRDFGPEGAFMPINNGSGEFELLDGNRKREGDPYKNSNRDSIKRNFDADINSSDNVNAEDMRNRGKDTNKNSTLSDKNSVNKNTVGKSSTSKTYYRDKNGRLVLNALTPIYFDFDKYSIRADMQDFIRANADFIKSRNIKNVILQGNTDEIGTDEYNMALGHKRALSVRDSLVIYGLPLDMFSTISYGVHNPVCLESTRECHARNRRAEIVEKD